MPVPPTPDGPPFNPRLDTAVLLGIFLILLAVTLAGWWWGRMR